VFWWSIPKTASDEKSPLLPTPDVLEKGKAVYSSHCQRCHGHDGKGDGPSGDPQEATADLTDGFRVSINPDGVVFYKVWNGRGRFGLKMPAFKNELSTDDAWAVVAYVQTLRKSE
jgi:copper transport protein